MRLIEVMTHALLVLDTANCMAGDREEGRRGEQTVSCLDL